MITKNRYKLYPGGYPPELVGLWEFLNAGNLGLATIGSDLVINGTTPGFSSSLSDSNSLSLNGVITTVQGSANNLLANHGIGANGGGTKTNIYSIGFDFISPASSSSEFRSFFQTNVSNIGDAEYFITSSGNGLGRGGIGYSPAITNGVWYRVVLVADLSLGSLLTYLNGSLYHTHNAPSVDGDYSLNVDDILLFADNGDENAPLHIAKAFIFNIALTATNVSNLGNPGDPIVI